MEKTGYIEIKIKGLKGNLELSPDNYDIREVIGILEQAERCYSELMTTLEKAGSQKVTTAEVTRLVDMTESGGYDSCHG